MRLFVSVRPSAPAIAHLEAVLAGRPTSRPDQWHVTLAFLGDVPRPDVLHDGLRAAAVAHPVSELRLEGGGAFPRARAVWAGVGGDTAQLAALVADVHEAARAAGVALDRGRFRPHVTVGRAGRVDPVQLADYVGPWWPVTEVELVQSVLGEGAVHTVLERFPLYQA